MITEIMSLIALLGLSLACNVWLALRCDRVERRNDVLSTPRPRAPALTPQIDSTELARALREEWRPQS